MKTKQLSWITLLLLMTFGVNLLYAQNSDNLNDLMSLDLQDLLNLTLVSAARREQRLIDSPRASSVITAKEIREKNYRTTPEALNELVGILVQETNYGGGAPIIRGLIGNQILILVDGIRLNNAIFRLGPNQYLNTIDIHQIAKIEVVRGTGSVLYGSDALGGLINIITKSREEYEEDIDIKIRAFGRLTSADRGQTGRIGLNGNVKNIGLVGGITYKKFGDLRAGSGAGLQPFTGYDEWDADIKLNYKSSEQQNIVVGLQHVNQANVPRTDKLIAGSDLKRDWNPETRDLAYVQFERKEINSFINALHIRLSYQNHFENIHRITSSKPNIQREYLDEVKTRGFMLQLHSSPGKRQRFTYGAEYYADDISSSRTDVDLTSGISTDKNGTFADGSTSKSKAVFVQDEIQVTQALNLTLGLRYSLFDIQAIVDDSNTGNVSVDSQPSALTASAHTLYKLTKSLMVAFGVAQGFRAPNIDDLTILGSFGSGFEVPNPNLEPEHSLNYELGFKAQHQKFSGSLYYFLSNFKNIIKRSSGTYNGLSFLDSNDNGIQDEAEDDIFQRQNFGKTRIQGIEADAQYQILPAWTLYGNIAWLKGDDLVEDNPLRRIPPIKGSFGVKWMLRRNAWMEYYNLFATKQDRLAPGDVKDPRIADGGTPGFVTFNFRGGLDFNKFGSVTIALENITNKGYRLHSSGIDSPGVNFVFGYELLF